MDLKQGYPMEMVQERGNSSCHWYEPKPPRKVNSWKHVHLSHNKRSSAKKRSATGLFHVSAPNLCVHQNLEMETHSATVPQKFLPFQNQRSEHPAAWWFSSSWAIPLLLLWSTLAPAISCPRSEFFWPIQVLRHEKDVCAESEGYPHVSNSSKLYDDVRPGLIV